MRRTRFDPINGMIYSTLLFLVAVKLGRLEFYRASYFLALISILEYLKRKILEQRP